MTLWRLFVNYIPRCDKVNIHILPIGFEIEIILISLFEANVTRYFSQLIDTLDDVKTKLEEYLKNLDKDTVKSITLFCWIIAI